MLVSSLVLVFAIACGDGESNSAEPTPAEGTPPTDAAAIREINLQQQSDVQAALTRVGGGKVADGEIAYADVTGDDREEAIVPITSGGTMGNVSYLVLTMDADETSLLLTRNLDPSSPSGINMKVEDGKLVEYIGEYGPEDPFCCPSVLRKTTFSWDGTKLKVEGEQRVPRGQQKQ